MVLHRERPPDTAPNVFAGQVCDIGYLGDWTVYRVGVPNGVMLRVSRANLSRFVEAPVGWEDPVFLSFAPDAAVILDR
jgi:putrescine transport system ATP-binding protein